MRKFLFLLLILILSSAAYAQVDTTCNFTLSHEKDSFRDIGGEGVFSVSTNNEICAWSAASNNDWITVKYNSRGTGFGTIYYTVDENPVLTNRTGVITLGAANITSGAPNTQGLEFTITQSNSSCIYRISPVNESFDFTDGKGVVSAYTLGGCIWEAASNETWISVETKSAGTENGKITYEVLENKTGYVRSGTLKIGEKTLLITQAPEHINCEYDVELDEALFDSQGGTSFIDVSTTEDNCFWTSTLKDNSVDWITIKSGKTGIGNSKIIYEVTENLTDSTRQADMLVAGSNFTVMQYGISHTIPVYRFYNFKTTAHFYTSSEEERDGIIQTDPGFQYEGVAFFAFDHSLSNTNPVYRFLNTESNTHFFTVFDNEALQLYNDLSGRYKYEGIAFYAFKKPADNIVPLYRFYKKDTDSHFYTISLDETLIVQDMELYTYEGIGFYVFSTVTK